MINSLVKYQFRPDWVPGLPFAAAHGMSHPKNNNIKQYFKRYFPSPMLLDSMPRTALGSARNSGTVISP